MNNNTTSNRGRRGRHRVKAQDEDYEFKDEFMSEEVPDVAIKLSDDVYKYNGFYYNRQGLQICGMKNRQGTYCSRLGECPFHINGRGSQLVSDTERQEIKNAILLCDPGVSRKEMQTYKKTWSEEEHKLFLEGIQRFGRGHWKEISLTIPGRTPAQVQSHAQKYFLKLESKKTRGRDIREKGKQIVFGGTRVNNNNNGNGNGNNSVNKGISLSTNITDLINNQKRTNTIRNVNNRNNKYENNILREMQNSRSLNSNGNNNNGTVIQHSINRMDSNEMSRIIVDESMMQLPRPPPLPNSPSAIISKDTITTSSNDNGFFISSNKNISSGINNLALSNDNLSNNIGTLKTSNSVGGKYNAFTSDINDSLVGSSLVQDDKRGKCSIYNDRQNNFEVNEPIISSSCNGKINCSGDKVLNTDTNRQYFTEYGIGSYIKSEESENKLFGNVLNQETNNKIYTDGKSRELSQVSMEFNTDPLDHVYRHDESDNTSREDIIRNNTYFGSIDKCCNNSDTKVYNGINEKYLEKEYVINKTEYIGNSQDYSTEQDDSFNHVRKKNPPDELNESSYLGPKNISSSSTTTLGQDSSNYGDLKVCVAPESFNTYNVVSSPRNSHYCICDAQSGSIKTISPNVAQQMRSRMLKEVSGINYSVFIENGVLRLRSNCTDGIS